MALRSFFLRSIPVADKYQKNQNTWRVYCLGSLDGSPRRAVGLLSVEMAMTATVSKIYSLHDTSTATRLEVMTVLHAIPAPSNPA